MNFSYGEVELAHLRARDRRLGRVIDQLGLIERRVEPDLFASIVRSIVGQQISTTAQRTVWERIVARYEGINPAALAGAATHELQALGMSHRKAEYIVGFAQAVHTGSLDLERVAALPDQEAIAALSSIRGIGRWTAEMTLLFSLQRPDIFAFDDLGIQRGLRMVYRHRDIDRARFERFRRRYSPYGSVASLYLWAVAGGVVPELTDPRR